MNRLRVSHPFLFWLVVFVGYTLLTVVIFRHRLIHPFTQFAMPDVDTDGGLWYQWYMYYTAKHQLLPDIMSFFAYPFGYDFSILPFSNLIYSIQLLVLSIIGFSWSHLVFVTNISSLITYPLSALGAALLAYYITKHKTASIFAGLIYGFSFYHIFMGRGQMSINHIEIIPFYLLSLVYFLDKKNIFSLTLSTLIFSILFKADPYYAFFSGICSVVICVFYGEETLLTKVKIFMIYYIALFSIFILTNFNFILSNLYLFNKTQLVQVGRNSIARNELLPTLYYTALPENSLLFTRFKNFFQLSIIVPEVIALAGLVYVKKNRTSVTFLFCFLVCTVLSSYVASFYFINVLYFRYFGMFRGVARMSLLTSLFLGILVAIALTGISRIVIIKKLRDIYKGLFLALLGVIIVITSLNTDLSWTRNTDLSKLAKLYEPIRTNDSIHVIATYPMTVNGTAVGCPQGYQLLGQIIHNKSYACGASPFSQQAIDYYKKISNIRDSKTIDILTHYGIESIFISNKLIKNSEEINQMLGQDTRLSYVGRYTQSRDMGYTSENDLSRDFSVYQINRVVQDNTHPQPLITTNTGSISYQKINPYMYVLHTSNLKNSILTLHLPYSEKWELYPGDQSKQHAFSLAEQTLHTPSKVSGESFNGWSLTEPGTYTIYFRPRALQVIADSVAMITLLLCLVILVLSRPKIVYTRS